MTEKYVLIHGAWQGGWAWLPVAGAMSRERAGRLLAEGTVDMIVFGRWFISNPDLVERLRNDWPLNDPAPKSFYPNPDTAPEGDACGYIDYPPYRG